jgi:hypothetical protein
MHSAIWKGKVYLTFDTCFEAEVKAETAYCLDMKHKKAFKFALKGRVAGNTRKNKGKGKASYNSGKGCSSQAMPHCLQSGSQC